MLASRELLCVLLLEAGDFILSLKLHRSVFVNLDHLSKLLIQLAVLLFDAIGVLPEIQYFVLDVLLSQRQVMSDLVFLVADDLFQCLYGPL